MAERRRLDVIGYTYDCDHWCADCLQAADIDPRDDEVGAIFDDEGVSDYPTHCCTCGEFLGGSLTSEGIEILKETYRKGGYRAPGGGPSDEFRKYMDYFDGVDWHFIWTFAGLLDPDGDLKG